ncbi:MAG: TetR/AcrR family transcriptional regulator [Solirubrobacteraceae bacterium]
MAAREVVAEHGAGGLSLDRVAAQAGLSKGGLMHHVRRKHDLLRALVEGFAWAFDADFQARGADASAYVAATFDAPPSDPERSAISGFLAVVAEDPAALDPLRERYAEWQTVLTDRCGDPAAATVARLACDGLWLAELLDLAPPERALRADVQLRLESMIARGRA